MARTVQKKVEQGAGESMSDADYVQATPATDTPTDDQQ